jgi:hypothetical protein
MLYFVLKLITFQFISITMKFNQFYSNDKVNNHNLLLKMRSLML